MAGKALTEAQGRKLDTVVASLQRKLGLKDEKERANLRRFADKYARNKLGIRGTGPHGHGFNKEQRGTIMEAVRVAFNIPAPTRKAPVRKAQPAKKASGNKKPSVKQRPTRPAPGARKSTAQLAKEQTARAAGTVVSQA